MSVLNPPFSRRDFLKLSGAGLLGAFLADLHLDRALAAAPTQGRMTLSGINLFSDPSFKARIVQIYNRDDVVGITGQVEVDVGNPYNNTWYQIENQGYTYSGWVQPVETDYQKPVFDIPSAGQLGEVTVPFSATRLDASFKSHTGYRAYFATTHWVTGVVVNPYEKGIWYKVYDSLRQTTLYFPATDLRLVPQDELTPLSDGISNDRKHIYVDTATQSVTAFEDDQAVLVTRCSSGGKGTPTPLGDFKTFHKGPTIHMTNDG